MLPRRSTGETSSLTTACVRSWEHLYANVAELDFVAVILEADVPLRRLAVVRHRLELARCNFLVPLRASEIVFDDLRAVEPVLDMITVDSNARRVPLSRRKNDAAWRRIQREVGPC